MNSFLAALHKDLGITEDLIADCKLDRCEQPPLRDLRVVDIDFEGKPFILLSSAAVAWKAMVASADSDQVMLKPFSGFRSYVYQKQLIEKQLAKGRELKSILTHIAIPGFSEHHTGRAVDAYNGYNSVLEESFELTPAFEWLKKNAAQFGFSLSYPRHNDKGIIYEPWHWYFHL